MLNISLFLFSLAITLCIGSGVFIYMAYRYKLKQRDITDELAVEASALIDRMQTRGTAAYTQTTPSLEEIITSDEKSLAAYLKTPEYLTTLCTVMVKKAGGEIRLYKHDFEPISLDDYVSIYLDTEDNSLLLRLNSIVPYMPGGDDDSTFH